MRIDIVNELDILLKDREVSIAQVLQKAIQLAAVQGNDNYRRLFEIHLSGQSTDDTAKLLNENAWVYGAFFKDRLKSDNKMSLTGSTASLERSLRLLEGDIEDAREEVRRAKAAQPQIVTLQTGIPIRVANTILQNHKNEFNSTAEILNRIRLRTNEFLRLVQNEKFDSSVLQELKMPRDTKKVFVVHGHDDAAKLSVARFLEKLDLEPIILHEQPNRGRTIIEKFEQHSDVGFAVVLLTPDDFVTSKGESETYSSRARQNVVFELGFFFAKLTRSNVCALLKSGVERPSDLDGIVYIEMDAADGWKLDLGRELIAAGFEINLNKTV